MMNPAPPQAPPGAPPAAGPQAPKQQSSAGQLVGQVGDGLMKLEQMFSQAKGAISPQDHQKLGSIIAAFKSLVDDLGKAPGSAPPQGPAPQGPMPPHAAMNSKPAPQY